MKKIIILMLITLTTFSQSGYYNGWSLNGNTLGNNTSYIGSNDNISFTVKTNGIERVKVDTIGSFRWIANNGNPLNRFSLRAYNGYSVIPAMYFSTATETDNNYAMLGDGTDLLLNAPLDSSSLYLTKGNGSFFARMQGNKNNSTLPTWQFRTSDRSTIPAGQNTINYLFSFNGSYKWIAGAIPLIWALNVDAPTITAAGASTATNVYTQWNASPINGSSITIINKWGFGTPLANITQSLVVGTVKTPSATLDVTGTMSVSGTSSLANTAIGGSLVVTGNILAPKLYGNTAAPTITAGSGLGTGAGTVISVVGNDICGIIGVKTGTASLGTSAVLTYVTFNSAYTTNAPVMNVEPYNLAAQNLLIGSQTYPSASTNTFAINTNTVALPANTTFSFSYHALGR